MASNFYYLVSKYTLYSIGGEKRMFGTIYLMGYGFLVFGRTANWRLSEFA